MLHKPTGVVSLLILSILLTLSVPLIAKDKPLTRTERMEELIRENGDGRAVR